MDLKKALVRSCTGCWKKSRELPASTTAPFSMSTTRLDTLRAKLISWVTTSMVMPSRANSCMTERTSPVNSGSKAEVGSSK